MKIRMYDWSEKYLRLIRERKVMLILFHYVLLANALTGM